jgi:hypothetical protein
MRRECTKLLREGDYFLQLTERYVGGAAPETHGCTRPTPTNVTRMGRGTGALRTAVVGDLENI